MPLVLTSRERILLEEWLPPLSPLGKEPTDARSLVATELELTPAEVRDRLKKLKVQIGAFRSERRTLGATPCLGRGRPRRRSGIDFEKKAVSLTPLEGREVLTAAEKLEAALEEALGELRSVRLEPTDEGLELS